MKTSKLILMFSVYSIHIFPPVPIRVIHHLSFFLSFCPLNLFIFFSLTTFASAFLNFSLFLSLHFFHFFYLIYFHAANLCCFCFSLSLLFGFPSSSVSLHFHPLLSLRTFSFLFFQEICQEERKHIRIASL